MISQTGGLGGITRFLTQVYTGVFSTGFFSTGFFHRFTPFFSPQVSYTGLHRFFVHRFLHSFSPQFSYTGFCTQEFRTGNFEQGILHWIFYVGTGIQIMFNVIRQA